MIPLYMMTETSWFYKSLGAQVALIPRIPYVYFHMNFQLLPLCKFSFTMCSLGTFGTVHTSFTQRFIKKNKIKQ